MPKKIISKGYTVEVVSWENDGDNTKTKRMNFDNLELATAVTKMCRELFCDDCNNDGIGNSCKDDETELAKEKIVEYMKRHPVLCEKQIANITDKKLIEICMNYNFKLLGGSEYYYSRVCESASLVYFPEDIYEIEI